MVDELQRMAPEIVVAGGSFDLPPPRDVPPLDRRGLLTTAQQMGTRKCLTDLVARVGLPAVEPVRLATGAREWPAGWTGSVSRRGTTVVAALAPADQLAAIGIDIERVDDRPIPPLRGLDATELPWRVSEIVGRTIVFSVKEAAFKALNPVFGRPLDFPDVVLSWRSLGGADSPDRCRGVARACGVTVDVRCSLAVSRWVVSVALWSAGAARSRVAR